MGMKPLMTNALVPYFTCLLWRAVAGLGGVSPHHAQAAPALWSLNFLERLCALFFCRLPLKKV